MSAERPGLLHTMALTLAIGTVTTLVIGSMMYYTLKRHDVAHLQDAERMAGQAAEQQAVVASQVIAAVSRSVLHSDLSRLQETVNTVQSTNGLRDVMIVNKDNMVLAAIHAGQVGQTLQDATWLSWKGQNREVAQRAAQNGEPVFAVVEPLKDKGETLAWAVLVFAVPDHAIALRAPMERLWETVRLMAPILVFLLMSIGFAMKLAAASIRMQIQGVMESVLSESPHAETDEAWLPKAS
jgi:hypothetical protein